MKLDFLMHSKYPALTLTALLTGSVAVATEHNVFTDLSIDCNRHGAVIKVAGGPTYYLGKECDALLPNVGEGRWWFAASAFVVEINGHTVRFANDLDCDMPYCRAT